MVLKMGCTRNGIKGVRKVYNHYGVYLVMECLNAFSLHICYLLFIKYYFQNLFIITNYEINGVL